ncbi:hypothetical protein EV132_104395 [Rhizobium sullae]|uniref:Uncharacterized protein n=1 Tax=Rhizobium sullae TaxID=50338 RepID=A0A4R3QGR9_RHISU|nr:hypothetical protein EV132_104395 [Rhizobium sullae]
MSIEARFCVTFRRHHVAKVQKQGLADAPALMVRLHPEVGDTVWRTFSCAPAADISVKLRDIDIGVGLRGEDREFVLHLCDDPTIEVALLECVACRPCGETDGANCLMVDILRIMSPVTTTSLA